MDDNRIIALYWSRSERAIAETDRKYGGYCRAIAGNILKSPEDAEECVSDTWFRAWDQYAAPKARPPAGFSGQDHPQSLPRSLPPG